MDATNDTLVGWQQNGGGRGTWNIIWSCLATLALSIWVCYHPRIHEADLYDIMHDANILGLTGFLKRRRLLEKERLLKFFNSFFIMFAGLLIPEIFASLAFGEALNARNFRDSMRRRGLEQFSMKESFFLTMGGYRVWVPRQYTQLDPDAKGEELRTLSARRFLCLLDWGVLGPHLPKDEKSDPLEGIKESSTVSAQTSKEINDQPQNQATQTEQTAIQVTPRQARLISPELIGYRSHSDKAAKLVVVCQALFFVINSIGRWVHNLPLALLEIITLSYIVLTLGAYGFWWFKPQNVEEATEFHLKLSEAQWQELRFDQRNNGDRTDEFDLDEITDAENKDKPLWDSSIVTVLLLCFLWWLSTGINFAAWNATFPTSVEQILWRVFIIVLMTMPIFFIGLAGLNPSEYTDHAISKSKSVRVLYIIVVIIVLVIGCLSKVGTLVLGFISLRAAPEAIYETWVSEKAVHHSP